MIISHYNTDFSHYIFFMNKQFSKYKLTIILLLSDRMNQIFCDLIDYQF